VANELHERLSGGAAFAVRLDEVNRCESRILREVGEQGRRVAALERQEREPLTPVEAQDDAHDEAAEAAVGVVEENGTFRHERK